MKNGKIIVITSCILLILITGFFIGHAKVSGMRLLGPNILL